MDNAPPVHRNTGNKEARHDQRLALLCGHTKAKVLVALATPATTTQLALRIHNSPSAVSQILHRLLQAGLVQQQRKGREVVYRLSSQGQRLLLLF